MSSRRVCKTKTFYAEDVLENKYICPSREALFLNTTFHLLDCESISENVFQICLEDVLEDKKNITLKTSSVRLHFFTSSVRLHVPLDGTRLITVRVLSHQEVSIKVYQRGDLNWASQLKPSGQQIFSAIISRPESTLIRQGYKGLL